MFSLPEPLDVIIFEKSSTWALPKKARMIYWWGCSGGGGGGGGCSGPQDTQRGGGGGGTAANIAWGFSPAPMFPDYIYIGVGSGGAGGGPDTAGSQGGSLFVARESAGPGGTIQHVVISAQTGLAGSAGTTTSGGSANQSGTSQPGIGLDFGAANFIGTTSQGTTGGLIANGANLNGFAGSALTGGTGGAGSASSYTAFSGGNITLNGTTYLGGAGSASLGGNGTDGQTFWLEKQPFAAMMRSTGGTGGGNSNTGIGGNGGYAGYGSGGGGGGAGITGGSGGAGGPAVLIISYW